MGHPVIVSSNISYHHTHINVDFKPFAVTTLKSDSTYENDSLSSFFRVSFLDWSSFSNLVSHK